MVAPAHHRMPVILRREDEGSWLAPDLAPEQRAALLAPYGDAMRAYRVNPRVGNVRNQDAGLIEQLAE